MKKGIAFLLVLSLVLASGLAAFAAGTVPGDVKGTAYEAAVTALMEKGVISGYPDGSYKPGATISRAEACVVVVKSMKPQDADLAAASGSSFRDLTGYDWAAKHIGYALGKGIISGYPDGTFRPADKVTYNELARMLVSALGVKSADLTGTWPDNYVNKAKALGIFNGFTFTGSAPALRGNVALMTFAVADQIASANKPADTGTPATPGTGTDYSKLAGPLAAYSGRAYGLVLDTAKVLNKDGDAVTQLEFLFGKEALYLNATKSFSGGAGLESLSSHLGGGDIYGLQMRDGIVQKLDVSSTSFAAIGSPTGFEDFTGGHWEEVKSVKNAVVTVNTADGDKLFSILDDASIYVATYEGEDIDGYKAGSLRDIKEGYSVRLYSVTGKNPGVVEIVVVAEESSDK